MVETTDLTGQLSKIFILRMNMNRHFKKWKEKKKKSES